MLVLTGEAPPAVWRVQNVFDAGMDSGTEFGETPEENLLSIAAVLLRDLEQAGLVASEVERVAELVKRFAAKTTGGTN